MCIYESESFYYILDEKKKTSIISVKNSKYHQEHGALGANEQTKHDLSRYFLIFHESSKNFHKVQKNLAKTFWKLSEYFRVFHKFLQCRTLQMI
jgi:hypothetical protein